MVKKRAKDDIGPATNGLALPDEQTLPYPLRVQAVYIHVGDYVQPATHPIYTLMDSAGAQHTYSFDLPGQVTRISVRPGQIFTRRERVFEFCCDSIAQDFAALAPPSKVKPLTAPPIQPRVATTPRPRPQPDAAQIRTAIARPQRRNRALAAVAAVLIGAVALLSQVGASDTDEQVAEQPVDRAANATVVVSE